MVILNNVTFYTPKEIAEGNMIVNRKGKGDYGFVLRLIKQGKLDAKIFNENSKIPYYMVPESEIKKYNERFTA